ncbi:cytochrome P450 [Microdochium trichocladiopsis]|uniref:Cytochrome P450 n=1 Tax=Microdochium trichocladiopsis TaxID=1682393 RepID=A0A9P8Y0A0_9PEZI|nr:cytochrome P450 [Microdochium trichocladiopsis]KAH7026136.1 cytochrome P450 [Microdochium trichocladiopsis]
MSAALTTLDLGWLTSLPGLATIFGTYVLGLSFYRLYLSPLAGIPGPKIAALTSLYNAYHDLFANGGGHYIWVVEDMHRRYGPIVRIRPDVVHVNDPAFIEQLYSQSPRVRRERYATVLGMAQNPGSILGTKDHDMHRRRRAVLNPLFSQANVRRLEPIINDTLTNLFGRMDGWARQGEPVGFNDPLRAATKDIIQAYAFGQGGPKYLDMEDCNKPFFDVVGPQPISHLSTHTLLLSKLLQKMPPALMIRLIPRVAVFIEYALDIHAQIDALRGAKDLPEGRTIFHEILTSDIPESEKQTKRLGEEALIMVIAGSDTTASTLACIMYHVLADRELLRRLKAELETVMPNPDDLPAASKLESLTLLNAIIQEAIRLYPGATHRQDRMAPDEDLVYTNPDSGTTYVIPRGYGIGMTAPLVNRHPSIYYRPNDFLPERYIENKKLDKYLFSFSKGTRQCIGINLAYQELQSFTAGIFRKYSLYDPDKGENGQGGPTLELFETTRRDITMHADCVTPKLPPGSQGLRLRIRN